MKDIRGIKDSINFGLKLMIAFDAVVVLIVLLVGCGNTAATSNTDYDKDLVRVEETEDTSESETITEDTTEVVETPIETTEDDTQVTTDPEPPVTEPTVDIDWTEIEYEMTDSDGWTYRITAKLSPWYFNSDANTDALNSAWSQIGTGASVPRSFEEFGFYQRGNNNNYVSGDGWAGQMTDKYLAIGTIRVENITEGFDITSSSPRTVSPHLAYTAYLSTYSDVPLNGSFRFQYELMYFGDGTVTCHEGFQNGHQIVMYANDTGEIPIVWMYPENITPNYPSGEFQDSLVKGYFCVSTWGLTPEMEHPMETLHPTSYLRLAVYGKDGEIMPFVVGE